MILETSTGPVKAKVPVRGLFVPGYNVGTEMFDRFLPAKAPSRLVLSFLPLVGAGCVVLYAYADRPLAARLAEFDGPARLFFELATHLGDGPVHAIGLPLIGLFCARVAKSRRAAAVVWFAFLAFCLTGVSVEVLKRLLGRLRPGPFVADGLYGFTFFSLEEDRFSFPSGHTATVASVALAIGFCHPRLGAAAGLAALLVAASRVAINAHYLSDVLCGGYLGLLVTTLLHDVFVKREVRMPWSEGSR